VIPIESNLRRSILLHRRSRLSAHALPAVIRRSFQKLDSFVVVTDFCTTADLCNELPETLARLCFLWVRGSSEPLRHGQQNAFLSSDSLSSCSCQHGDRVNDVRRNGLQLIEFTPRL
jgi:hypothetical protein